MCCLNPSNYGSSATSTWPIGNIIGYVHETIYDGIARNEHVLIAPHVIETYCIGFSLGAHVCGFFGKILKERLGEKYKLTKIIGLDPAGPIFQYPFHSKKLRLHKDDAATVEIFHTNAQTLGFRDQLGDVDYYINGGFLQPWCLHIPIDILDYFTSLCHHTYSRKLMQDLLDRNIPCVFKCRNQSDIYIGSLRHSSTEKLLLKGRYELKTKQDIHDKTTECTILCN